MRPKRLRTFAAWAVVLLLSTATTLCGTLALHWRAERDKERKISDLRYWVSQYLTHLIWGQYGEALSVLYRLKDEEALATDDRWAGLASEFWYSVGTNPSAVLPSLATDTFSSSTGLVKDMYRALKGCVNYAEGKHIDLDTGKIIDAAHVVFRSSPYWMFGCWFMCLNHEAKSPAGREMGIRRLLNRMETNPSGLTNVQQDGFRATAYRLLRDYETVERVTKPYLEGPLVAPVDADVQVILVASLRAMAARHGFQAARAEASRLVREGIIAHPRLLSETRRVFRLEESTPPGSGERLSTTTTTKGG